MLPNGFIVTLDMALGKDGLASKVERAKYALYVLGIFRENVYFVPGTALAMPSLSSGHLWPRSREHFAGLYRSALDQARSGGELKAAFLLGRAMHVLIDMACPSHAQYTWHYLSDPFERYVDGHARDLASLPLPQVDSNLQGASPEEIVESLAREAQLEMTDHTQTPWGRLLRRLGMRRPLKRGDVEPQARRLIPLAAAYLRVVLNNFEREVSLRELPLAAHAL